MNENELLAAAADMFERFNLAEIRLKSGDNEVFFKKQADTVYASPAPQTPDVLPITQTKNTGNPAVSSSYGNDSLKDLYELKSPLLGIFYSRPEPGAEPFVKVGDSVKKGDILCIVEAMKMMNEICAECDGTIHEICAEEGKIVEYNSILFRIKPDKK